MDLDWDLEANENANAAIKPFVVSSIIGACVNCIVAAQNRKQQRELHFANQQFQEAMQEKQQAFMRAIEERRLEAAAELQLQIIRLQHENALELQKNAFAEQRSRDSYNRFCSNSWPLAADPDFYVEYLKKTYREDMMPLQIIVPATMPKESFNGIDKCLMDFFNDVYSPRSGASAFYYNQGWKDSMYGASGNAQIAALHSVLAGLPTLLLILQKVGDEFYARISFWGVADMDRPENKTIFTVNQKELDLDILRDNADQIIKVHSKYNLTLPQDTQDKNIQTRVEERKRLEELKKRGNIPEDEIKKVLNWEFSSRYTKVGKEDVILKERNKYLSVMLEIVSAAFTDAYYLTSYNITPRIPELCANNPDFRHPEVIDLFQQIFSGLLETTANDTLNTPLRYALVADSFKRNGFEEIAQSYARKCAEALQNLLQNGAKFSSLHHQAIKLLEDYPEFAELKENIQSLPAACNTGLIAASSFDEEFFSNIPLAEDVSLEMIKVKAGSFMMGSPEDEIGRDSDETLHKVTLTQDYWLGKFSVTEAQFKAVMKYSPSGSSPLLPVFNVDWNVANDFCTRLNKKFKDKLPAGYQFALPTEAQWEYACRAGTTTAYCWGNSCNGIEANCNGDHPCGTGCKGPNLGWCTNVGSYAPNDWGFYDMHGNVCEWCRDWKGDYDEGEVTDPIGPLAGSRRVKRGGYWNYYAQCCRSAYRDSSEPTSVGCYLGLRLALVPIQ